MLSRDQLSRLGALLQGTEPPHVAGLGHCVAKRVNLTGVVTGTEGHFQIVELFGPTPSLLGVVRRTENAWIRQPRPR